MNFINNREEVFPVRLIFGKTLQETENYKAHEELGGFSPSSSGEEC
jgi:hypothetical protein